MIRVYEVLPEIEKSISLAEKGNASTISFFLVKISAVVRLFIRYKKALEGLTPGGSEFVDDPERCAQVVKDTRDSQHRVLTKWKTDQNAKNENIRIAAEKIKAFFDRLEESNDPLDVALTEGRKRYHAPVRASLDIILNEVK